MILLRYYEDRGEEKRALSVFKKRRGAHERTIRDIEFSSRGIEIGPPLRQFRGILQHRVKNNFQVIQSLLRLSAKRAPADLAAYFEEVRRQIWAIGQAHHKVYAGGNLDHIDLSSYITDIVDQSVIALGRLNDRIPVTI